MKKLVLSVIIVIALSATAHAQTDKGDWMVGGNMLINTTSGNSQFTLLPNAGYFFARSFAAGANFQLSFGKTETKKYTVFSVGPFARYYFDLKNDQLKLLVHANVNVATQTDKYPTFKNSSTTTEFFVGGGAAYFINQNVALEGIAGYNNTKVENIDAAGGFQFRIGFQVHLLGHEVKLK